MSSVDLKIAGGVAHLTISRPEKRNALDRVTLETLSTVLQTCAADAAVRVIQLTGAGEVFTAGADLEEMRAQVYAGEADNLAHARKLATLLTILDGLAKPTLARVNGDGYGGALGLMAACDIVVVVEPAKFSFTEVRLGIIPAVISPFVLAKIGERAARRLFLTAEIFSAARLREIGLAHEVVARGALDQACDEITQALLRGAPGAQAEAKQLIRQVAHGTADGRGAAAADAAARLARLRVQPEAQEGFAAFFEKRKATWRLD